MDLEQYLSTKEDCTPAVDAETLKLYGHRAAAQFVGGQVPMNDSIVQMAKEAGLNQEQVKRVVEHANNLAFSQMFKAGFSQNITFPMADTSVVLQNLESPMQTKQASVSIPRRERYIPGQEGVSLEAAFGASPVSRVMEKVASPQTDVAALSRQYLDKTAEVRQLRSDIEVLADRFELEQNRLDLLIKQAHASGNDAETIGACIDSAQPSDLMGRYLADRYGSTVRLGSITKLAQMGMEVAPNPVTDATTTLQGIQEQLFQLQDMIQQGQQQVDMMLMTMQQPVSQSPTDKLFRPANPPMLGAPQGMPPGMPPGPPDAAPDGSPHAPAGRPRPDVRTA